MKDKLTSGQYLLFSIQATLKCDENDNVELSNTVTKRKDFDYPVLC